jgi:hypothetical protein
MKPKFEEQSFLRAKKRVKEIRDFYEHLTVYVVALPVLIVINYYATPDEMWVWNVAMGWGIAIAIHTLLTFTLPFLDKGWEQRKIMEILDKEKSKTSSYGKQV